MPFLDEQGLQRLWENIVAEVDSKTQGYPPIYKEGSVVTFDSLKGLGINATSVIEPTQAGTGEASPDNVRAISGYNVITLQNTGKNLIPLPYENSTKTSRGITFTLNSDGTITANGTATENASFHITTRMYLPAGEYRISGGLRNNARIVANKYNVSGSELSGVADTSGKGATLTLTESTRLHIYIVIIAGETVNNEVFKPQLEAGTTTTEYEQSKYKSVEVDLNNTVYGGSYDWKTGKLVVDRECVEFNGTENWYSANWSGTSVIALNLTKSYKSSIIKSHFNTELYKSDNLIVLNNTKYNYTLESWKTYLQQQKAAGTPLQVIMRLETPETYYLTPYDFETIEGLNTVWSNCGPTKGIFNTFATGKELNEAIEDIKIGGRNLLKKLTLTPGKTGNISVTDYSMQMRISDHDTWIKLPIYGTLKAGEEYVFSAECEGFPEGETYWFYFGEYYRQQCGFKNGKVSAVIIPSADHVDQIILDDLDRAGITFDRTVTIKNIKLERGNKPTDWTPAPEDVDAAIAEASETVKTTVLTPSSKTKYYPTLSDNAATETDSLIKNSSISVNLQNGTTSAAGVAQLILGNGTATGTAGNMTGYITLYAANGSDHRIYPSDNGVSCVHTLPPNGGTLVSGSNYTAVIPAATTSKAGLLSAADKQKLDELVSGGDNGESTITYVTAGKGLTGGGASGNVTLNIGAGSGISVADDSISVNTSYTTSGKNYKVQVDSTSGGLFVNVPWTDNNTTYVNATQSAAGLMSAADKTKLDDNVVLKMSGDGTHGYVSYRGVATKYFGGTTVPYIRIALPCSTSWGMFTMRVLMRENYSTGTSGEILIYGNHSSAAEWNTFNATCIGTLSSNVKVYGSDKKYFYIACGNSYSGVSVEEMLVGDSAVSYDLRNITIDYVSELPATYQTAYMHYALTVGSNRVVAVDQGGTGATTAAGALANLGAVSTSGGTLNTGATLKLNTYGTRVLTLGGDSINFDLSAETGGWALQLASVKDVKGDTTALIGAYGNPTSGLDYAYMGGSYSDPALKMSKAGVFTFKNTVDANISGSAASASVLGIASCTNTDLNTLKGSTYRVYQGYTGMTNAPVQTIGVLEVLPYSGDWVVQRFTKIHDENNAKEYVRHYYNGSTWSSWRQYVTTGTNTTWGINISGSAGSVAWGNVTSKTNATQSAAGLMSADDKKKLDGIDTATILKKNSYGSAVDLNGKYDTEVFNITSGNITNGPHGYGYGQGLVLSYRKHSGNTIPDYASQIYVHGGNTTNDSQKTMFYRTSSQSAWYDWQMVAHGVAGTAVGNATTPVYMNKAGQIVAGTALGTAAYAASTSFAPATHTHDTYLPYSGGTLTGSLSTSATVPVSGKYFRNIDIQAASTSSIVAGSSLATGTILIKYQ